MLPEFSSDHSETSFGESKQVWLRACQTLDPGKFGLRIQSDAKFMLPYGNTGSSRVKLNSPVTPVSEDASFGVLGAEVVCMQFQFVTPRRAV